MSAPIEERLAVVEEQLADVLAREQTMRTLLFEVSRAVRADHAHLVVLRQLLAGDAEEAEERVDREIGQILEAVTGRPKLRILPGGRKGVGTADTHGRDRHGLHLVV